MTTPTPAPALDPLAVLRGIASLRKLAGSYPAGHPMIAQKLRELDEVIAGLLRSGSPVRIDVIRGEIDRYCASALTGSAGDSAHLLR